MQIVKAEILWTRVCPLRCHYCNMATGKRNTVSIEDWQQGIEQLKQLGCSFVAIYGAEPLSDFEKLPSFIKMLSDAGIDNTVITSSHTPTLEKKLSILYDAGLRSLTTSYDIVPLDKSSALKSSKALETLNYFRSLGPVDNVAAVVTLNRTNYQHLVASVQYLSSLGIWTFFDMIHADRNQPGSKVLGKDTSLMFTELDIPLLLTELDKLQEIPDLLIHNSSHFIETVRQDGLRYSWNCAAHKEFPSWVTIDCDGLVYPCDDFQDISFGVPLTTLARNWQETQKKWRDVVSTRCPGCLWNTHIDAHAIKEGTLKITSYIHKS